MASIDVAAAMQETVWLNANSYYEAERRYYESSPSVLSVEEQARRANPGHHNPGVKNSGTQPSLASEIAYARQKIQNFLKSGETGMDFGSSTVISRLENVEKEQATMKQHLEKLTSDMTSVLSKLSQIENYLKMPSNQEKVLALKKSEPKENLRNGSTPAADNDDLDLFGSDEEDADAAKLREERLQTYASKKAKKPAVVAKSSVILDVKPWDDETDMKDMETHVKTIQTEGLVWGASKLVPLAYGIKKLQIVAIVEDEKVSIDWLQETIMETVSDLVQSVDIAAFNKL